MFDHHHYFIRMLLLILVLVGVIIGYTYFNTGSVPRTLGQFLTALPPRKESLGTQQLAQLSQIQIPRLTPENTDQFKTFEDRASSVSSQIGDVLGTAIQEASESGNIQDKVFEYGRYLYCQQVVEEYEEKQVKE